MRKGLRGTHLAAIAHQPGNKRVTSAAKQITLKKKHFSRHFHFFSYLRSLKTEYHFRQNRYNSIIYKYRKQNKEL